MRLGWRRAEPLRLAASEARMIDTRREPPVAEGDGSCACGRL